MRLHKTLESHPFKSMEDLSESHKEFPGFFGNQFSLDPASEAVPECLLERTEFYRITFLASLEFSGYMITTGSKRYITRYSTSIIFGVLKNTVFAAFFSGIIVDPFAKIVICSSCLIICNGLMCILWQPDIPVGRGISCYCRTLSEKRSRGSR